jgi:hypothetical protein
MGSLSSRRGAQNRDPRLLLLLQSRYFLLCALISLVSFWVICFIVIAQSEWMNAVRLKNGTIRGVAQPPPQQGLPQVQQQVAEQPLQPRILSRSPNVKITTDVRGNLGPPEVMIQAHPGKDWLKDRWQAASDMHGSALPGRHWVHLDLGQNVVLDKVILDWEAAYADVYMIQASLVEPITDKAFHTDDKTWDDDIWVLFDGRSVDTDVERIVETSGQSPGVKTKTPLHVVHTILVDNKRPLRYLRIYIMQPAVGWGVSMWQVDLYGLQLSEIQQ